jgi:hypothetical protein
MKDKFWLQSPKDLFSSLEFIPNSNMSINEKLNSLTRLALLITIVLYAMNYEYWLTFLLVSLLLIISLYCYNNKKEHFSVTPTYQSTHFDQTIVAPTFSEEWQIPPPAYDLINNASQECDDGTSKLQPQSYPYGQILSKTNVLPADEYDMHQLNGGVVEARNYANSAFLRRDLAYREDMTRLYKKKLSRRYRNSTCSGIGDSYSPFHSY